MTRRPHHCRGAHEGQHCNRVVATAPLPISEFRDGNAVVGEDVVRSSGWMPAKPATLAPEASRTLVRLGRTATVACGSVRRVSADDLAAELLEATLDADPLEGSLYGFPGYDDRLPDLSAEAEASAAARHTSISERAARLPDGGLGETEHQTLDFVRQLASGMAGAPRSL